MRRSSLTKPALGLSMAAMLFTGVGAIPSASSGPPAESAAGVATNAVDQAAPSAARHVRALAVRYRGIPFLGPANVISVDVNPTLPGTQRYRVVLKVKEDGEWVRCAVKRTRNRAWDPRFTYGRAPHEMVFFDACKDKATRQYKVVIPAQHGFLRTVVWPVNADWSSAW
jgi:hypothetical protein